MSGHVVDGEVDVEEVLDGVAGDVDVAKSLTKSPAMIMLIEHRRRWESLRLQAVFRVVAKGNVCACEFVPVFHEGGGASLL